MKTIETARKELDKVRTPMKQAYIKSQLANVTVIGCDEDAVKRFIDAMNDDLNTPNGYAEIYETVKKLNQALRQRETNGIRSARKSALWKRCWRYWASDCRK